MGDIRKIILDCLEDPNCTVEQINTYATQRCVYLPDGTPIECTIVTYVYVDGENKGIYNPAAKLIEKQPQAAKG